jgi:hypothetical protein
MEICCKNYTTKSTKPEQMKNLYICLKINKENVEQFVMEDKIFQILHIYLMQKQKNDYS